MQRAQIAANGGDRSYCEDKSFALKSVALPNVKLFHKLRIGLNDALLFVFDYRAAAKRRGVVLNGASPE